MKSQRRPESRRVPAIEAQGLILRAGDRLLADRLDLCICPGQFFVIAGPSGTGKTTLLQALAGFTAPGEGKVEWKDREWIQPPAVFTRQAGFVYQHLRLADQLDALTNVCCGRLGQYGCWHSAFGFRREEREQAYGLLASLGLPTAADKPVGVLSGGERQRVALARALHQDPLVYFVDEPVANLDRANAQIVLARLQKEVTGRGKTVVAVLHDERHIRLYADQVLRWDRETPSLWKQSRVRKGKA
ncbi:MAG: ATP-binding cassette domain-containing protein [Verrucomicrobia bacterium]|jgi:phosphonate transport system ATP-binding protein|nr:ATP-binding cassette domain-containing protein [Verrucomicrobiota bacterium]